MSRSSESTVLWDISRILLVAAGLAFVVALVFGLRPVENPGVQDCGTPLGAMIRNDPDTVVPILTDDAPDNAAGLRSQTSCSERVSDELTWVGLAAAAGVVLGFAGALTGLADDRAQVRRAPRFETMLRRRPEDAPSRGVSRRAGRPDDPGSP